ncbi:MAG: hypothetical protein MUF03_02920 [Rubrivivax sp.]|nr:hypothetical protein [Rubrivivax sp.]
MTPDTPTPSARPPRARPAARRRLLAALMSLAPLAAVPAAWAAAPDGRAIETYIDYCGALLGLNWNASQRAELRRQAASYWTDGNPEGIRTVLGAADAWQRLQSTPQALRDTALRMSRPDVLLSLQQAAARGDRDSRWLLDRYHEQNRPLAPGKPDGLPLTREMVEARLGVQHFLATEIHRQPAPVPDAATVEASVRSAIAVHPTLTAAQQVELARQPGELARLRYGWARASAADRLLARAETGARLSAAEQAQVQQVMAGLNAQLAGLQAQQQSMLASSMQSMRQNSEIIMGRGTVWNPATNRWEQQGGIVTEFNGVVRVP